jgi:N-acetylmuramoyl-L-alanine amidase
MKLSSYLVVFGFTVVLLGSSTAYLSPGSAASPATARLDLGSDGPLIIHQVSTTRKLLTKRLTVVRDLRVKAHPDFTRVVLDLQRNVTFTQSRQKNPDRVVIKLQNATLGKAARAKLTSKEFPDEIDIAQSHPRAVTVSLNLKSISDYRIHPLSRPARLVVDLINRTDDDGSRAADQPPSTPVITPGATPPLARAEVRTVVIDPGHGGKDAGAVGRRGTEEKDITLKVGLRLRDLITQQLGKRVLMTRDKDVFVELEDRAKFANSKDADLFVSIHVNSHPHRSTKGLEVYHFGEASDRRALEVAARENGTPLDETGVGWQYLVADLLTTKKIEDSLGLAWTTKQAMVSYLDGRYDLVDHGVKTAPFYVLRFTTMPSILAEIAFISNPSEEQLMQSDAFLSRIAEALFQGIKAFVNPHQTSARQRERVLSE